MAETRVEVPKGTCIVQYKEGKVEVSVGNENTTTLIMDRETADEVLSSIELLLDNIDFDNLDDDDEDYEWKEDEED